MKQMSRRALALFSFLPIIARPAFKPSKSAVIDPDVLVFFEKAYLSSFLYRTKGTKFSESSFVKFQLFFEEAYLASRKN